VLGWQRAVASAGAKNVDGSGLPFCRERMGDGGRESGQNLVRTTRKRPGHTTEMILSCLVRVAAFEGQRLKYSGLRCQTVRWRGLTGLVAK
jgi:hypothetical protein